jgi:hypothetical protein
VSGISKKAQPLGPVAGSSGTPHSDWACQQLACVTAGAEKGDYRMRPEKPWFRTEGRGFDSRHLHLPACLSVMFKDGVVVELGTYDLTRDRLVLRRERAPGCHEGKP